ncbi:MAG: ABC transporter permease [Gemmatimonas sp.]
MPQLPNSPALLSLVARCRSRIRALFRRDSVEQDMHDEFAHHVAERADHLVRMGVTRADAEHQARREFGHADSHRASARDAMGLRSITQLQFSWLDVKLGARMLVKYPMLNFAAVFALAIGIPVGLAPGHLARVIEAPLPGDTSDRVRGLRYWDPLSSSVAPVWSNEFAFWSDNLRSFSAIGAFRTAMYNVTVPGGALSAASGAELTEGVLAMLGAKATLGRNFTSADFSTGAPRVVVIGHDLWASRFGSDKLVIGKRVTIGRESHTIVGVMPDGFAFPSRESLWVPMSLTSVGGVEARTRVQVIGRLADGVTAAQAQAELSQMRPPQPVGSDASDARERARARAEVVPFSLLYLSLPAGGLASMPEFRYVQLLLLGVLLVACGNVAMLVFARTATRMRELAIRTSLGASRARIVSQICVETSLLAVIAAAIGLLGFSWAFRHVNIAQIAGETQLPYWLSLDASWQTALAALTLAIASATVSGVLPALSITKRSIASHMRGASRVRFGKLTGALVVADIAVSVAAVGMAYAVVGHATDVQAADRATGIRASEYLAVGIDLSGVTSGRAPAVQRDLVAALEREPGVRSVAVSDALPRMEHRSRPYALDGDQHGAEASLRWTRTARVDVNYLNALGVRVRNGRDFVPADVDGDAHVAIVNTAFVSRVFEGRDPIGQRVRLAGAAASGEQVYEIVGVVDHLGVNIVNPEHGEAVYVPGAAGAISSVQLAVHTSVSPLSLAGRVREIAASVSPEVIVGKTALLSDVRQGDWYLVMGVAVGLIALVAVLVALAATGLYAMLSLSVTERTREIGIRAALGATRQSLVMTVLRRSVVQIGVGAAIGLPFAARFAYEFGATETGQGPLFPPIAIATGFAIAIVSLVGVTSCLVPTRRILGVPASEAMRADG